MNKSEVRTIVLELLSELVAGTLKSYSIKTPDGDEHSDIAFDGEEFVCRVRQASEATKPLTDQQLRIMREGCSPEMGTALDEIDRLKAELQNASSLMPEIERLRALCFPTFQKSTLNKKEASECE